MRNRRRSIVIRVVSLCLHLFSSVFNGVYSRRYPLWSFVYI